MRTEWAHSSLIWLLASLADVGFSFLRPQGVFRYSLLGVGPRSTVVPWNLMLSAVVLLSYCTVRALVCHWAQRFQLTSWQPARTVLNLFWRFARVLAVAIFVFIYLASWTTFHQTGRFLDFEAFAFWWNSPNIVMTHLASFSPTQYVGGTAVDSAQCLVDRRAHSPHRAESGRPRARRGSERHEAPDHRSHAVDVDWSSCLGAFLDVRDRSAHEHPIPAGRPVPRRTRSQSGSVRRDIR